MTYIAADDRYSKIPYRRCGRSGVLLPEISLGLWQNFGDGKPIEDQRAILRRAFDLGVTHFDLANNYGYLSCENTNHRLHWSVEVSVNGKQDHPHARRGTALPRD
jgi:hypothetical protein